MSVFKGQLWSIYYECRELHKLFHALAEMAGLVRTVACLNFSPSEVVHHRATTKREQLTRRSGGSDWHLDGVWCSLAL